MQNTIARKKTRIRQRECTRFYIRLQIKISFLEDRHKTALDDLKSEGANLLRVDRPIEHQIDSPSNVDTHLDAARQMAPKSTYLFPSHHSHSFGCRM